jgi:hypothetical protein
VAVGLPAGHRFGLLTVLDLHAARTGSRTSVAAAESAGAGSD